MGVHVEMLVKVADISRKFAVVIGFSFFTMLNGLDVRYSRLDIALDDYEGMLDFKAIERKVKAGEVISLSRKEI